MGAPVVVEVGRLIRVDGRRGCGWSELGRSLGNG